MSKVKVSSDFLYARLMDHDIIISMIATRMGVSKSIVRDCFQHRLNRHGKPLKFSQANIARLNTAIGQIAKELRECLIPFGSNQTFTNQWGKVYDPGVMPAFNKIASYFNMTALTNRLLGWKKSKRNTVFCVSSGIYGHVTKEDVDSINAELLAVAGILESIEVVADDDAKPVSV